MPAYVIAHVDVADTERMAVYRTAMLPTVSSAGGRILSAGQAQMLEGAPLPDTNVIIEFESVEKAHAWFYGDAYQAVVHERHAATNSAVVAILEGLLRRQP